MSLSLFDLTGKRALITGSSQGIGLALARGMAQAGAQIVLNGRDTAKLEASKRAFAELEWLVIIRWSSSPWSSPLHVVPKANKKL